MSDEHKHAGEAQQHLRFLGLVKGGGSVGAAVCVGLFACRWLNEFVPDALGIGVSMFAAGYVAGMLNAQRRALRATEARGHHGEK